MLSTPCRKACAAVAAAAWTTGGLVLADIVAAPPSVAQPHLVGGLLVSVAVAITCTLGLVLRVRLTATERAFMLGYDAGLHDGIAAAKTYGGGQETVVPFPRTIRLK